MKLCRECKNEVSEQAIACPNCGAPYPARDRWDGHGFEYKTKTELFGLPLLHISFKYRQNRVPVPAVGVVAIGQFAAGWVTISQFGIGLVSISQFTAAVAAFYWLLHFGLEVDNRMALLIADMILLATSLLLLFICLRSWFQVSRDLRPFLVVRISQRELVLPRSGKTYPLDGNETFLIAHDYFDSGNDSEVSELNFIDPAQEPATRTLLLHFLDRCRYFDKIGEDLAQLGVPFQLREHRDQ